MSSKENHNVDALLSSWSDIAEKKQWSGLLLGNGASQAIWKKFGYESLYKVASSCIDEPLTNNDLRIFEGLKTENFETVLTALRTTEIVCKSLGIDKTEILI